VNFLHQEQILGAYLAKEITLEDIAYIANQKKLKLFMVGHGHLNMFYSKRQLIDNFMHFNEDENLYHNRQDMKIIEENRKDEAYPILEDRAGTHVFRSKVFSSLAYIDQLKNLIDYLVIDSIFKDDLYALKVSKLYQKQVATPSEIIEIQEAYKEIWDEGFFYKKTIYKQKG
jgi:putative protease